LSLNKKCPVLTQPVIYTEILATCFGPGYDCHHGSSYKKKPQNKRNGPHKNVHFVCKTSLSKNVSAIFRPLLKPSQ